MTIVTVSRSKVPISSQQDTTCHDISMNIPWCQPAVICVQWRKFESQIKVYYVTLCLYPRVPSSRIPAHAVLAAPVLAVVAKPCLPVLGKLLPPGRQLHQVPASMVAQAVQEPYRGSHLTPRTEPLPHPSPHHPYPATMPPTIPKCRRVKLCQEILVDAVAMLHSSLDRMPLRQHPQRHPWEWYPLSSACLPAAVGRWAT